MDKLKLIFLFILFASFSKAQQTKLLTLDEAIKLSLENNKSLKISLAKSDVATARYNQAIDAALPSITAAASYQRLSDLSPPTINFPGIAEPVVIFPIYVNNYTTRLSASEIVFSGFRAKYAQESLRLIQQAAKLDADKDRDEIIFNTVQAYYNLYKIKESKKIVAENLLQLEQRINETRKQEQHGTAVHNDVLRWELQQSNLELTQLDIANSERVANYNMNLYLGLNDVQIEVDTNAVNKLNEEKALSDYMSKATTSRADLQAINMRLQSAENNLKVANNSYLPQISIGGDLYNSRPNPRVIPPKDEFTFTWDVGVFFTWDLMRLYSNKHNVDEAKANLSQSKEAANQLSDAVKMEVNQDYLAWKEANQKINVLQKSVDQSEENYRIMDSRYQNSLVLMSDLLDADNTRLNSKINLALARADAQVAYYRLVKSVGSVQ